jgi:H+-transporting ATPase
LEEKAMNKAKSTPNHHAAVVQPGTDSSEKKLTLNDYLEQLHVTLSGLSQEDVQKRQEQYGYNELIEEKTSPVLKFLSYFWGPIPWMIEAAIILSALVGHWEDFGIIFALLVVNGVVGFWEEYQAGNAIAALKANLALRAKVLRDGNWTQIPARELVPGDVIQIRLGDIVPADAILVHDNPVQVDQSALTGESLPVTRSAEETVYSGSIVKQGETGALVTATGGKTFFGKTAQLVEATHTTSHFQRAVLRIGNYLIFLAIALVVIILGVALFRGNEMVTTLQFALVLTVAAIPVAMPTVLSVTMAAGARLLSAKQVIVSRLASIEELAGIDVLCSDKTGTLTQNKLSLGEPFSVEGVSPQQLVLFAALASRSEDQDPIDLAVIGGLKDESAKTGYQVLHFQPFDPVHKRTEATVRSPGGEVFKVTKGAAQVILELAANSQQVREQVSQAVEAFAERGFRALGVASTAPDGRWQFMGVLPLFDPPREDSRSTNWRSAKRRPGNWGLALTSWMPPCSSSQNTTKPANSQMPSNKRTGLRRSSRNISTTLWTCCNSENTSWA